MICSKIYATCKYTICKNLKTRWCYLWVRARMRYLAYSWNGENRKTKFAACRTFNQAGNRIDAGWMWVVGQDRAVQRAAPVKRTRKQQHVTNYMCSTASLKQQLCSAQESNYVSKNHPRWKKVSRTKTPPGCLSLDKSCINFVNFNHNLSAAKWYDEVYSCSIRIKQPRHAFRVSTVQEAQLPQRNSASSAHVYLGC